MLYVITGPPCSGKSTWVRERAKPGDVVVDMDRLALAITAEETEHHHYPRHIRNYARFIRQAAVTCALGHAKAGGAAYIIDSTPGTRNRSTYHRQKATFVHLDAPTEVLLERARGQRPEHVLDMIRNWTRGGTDATGDTYA